MTQAEALHCGEKRVSLGPPSTTEGPITTCEEVSRLDISVGDVPQRRRMDPREEPQGAAPDGAHARLF